MRCGGQLGVCAAHAAFVCLASFSPSAHAAYTVTPLVTGQSSTVAPPGSTIQVDILLTTATNDRHDAAQFRVELSEPGFVLLGYTWSSPYSTLFDQSRPAGGQLPVAITNDLLKGDGFPDATADIEFSNLTDTGEFGAGILLSFQLMVPANWAGSNQVSLQVVPDLFTRGFDEVEASSVGGLWISIPAPPVVAAILFHCGIWPQLRRSLR